MGDLKVQHHARRGGERRWSLVASLAVVAGLLATGCGGGGDDGDGSSSPEESGEASGPTYGGDLVYALEAETSGGWCVPEAQLAISGIMVAWSVYDFLVVPDDEGGFSPYLAESVEPNPEATEFTITLRDGITFHDGSALDATVVKNNIDAWLGRYPGRTALLLPVILAQVDAVEVVDDLTLTISTKIPWPAFPLYLYSGGRLGIMAQAQLDDAETCDRNLIGTGPYKFEDWQVNDFLKVVRNDDYWATDAEGNQLPYLDSLEFRPVPDAQTRVNGLLGGEYDIAMASSATATETLEAEADAGTVDLVQSTVNTEVVFTMFNEAHPPFDDREARLAVATAIDRDQYSETVGLGLFEMASGPYPPGAPGYLEDAGYPEFDLEEAKALVADYEARTGNDFEFTYAHSADDDNVRLAQFLQEQWEAAGMEVNLQSAEQATLINMALGPDWDTIATRNFPGGYPDSNYSWWHTGSPINFGRVADAELDMLMERARSELDEETAIDLYEEANRTVNDGVHFAWANWVEWTIATRPGIKGILGAQLPNGLEFAGGFTSGHSTAAIQDPGGG